jgi:hypothetical protein
MWRYAALALLVACDKDEPPVSSCADEVLELARDGGAWVEPEGEIEFAFGGQGGFHADLGAWVRTEDTAVALTVRVLDLQGELVAQSSEAPVYVALADHSEESCQGWAVTRTFLGGAPQLDPAAACAFDGQEVNIEVEATPLAQLDTSEPLVLSVPGRVRVTDSRCP